MVSRAVDSAFLAEISKSHFNPVILLWLDWPDDPVRAHTGVGNISFDGHTWAGVGRFATVALPEDEDGLAMQTATFGLIGAPSEIVDMLDAAPRDMACAVWFGAVTTPAGNTLIGLPCEVFRGMGSDLREVLAATETGRTTSVRLGARTGPSQRARSGLYHTNEQHQIDHPGDTLFRHAAGAEDAYRRGIDDE